VKFRDQVRAGDTLLAVEKKLASDPRILRQLDALSERIFTIDARESPADEFRRELSGQKTRFMTAIQDSHLDSVEELAARYRRLALSFSKYTRQWGGVYTSSEATKEQQMIFGGWEDVGRLARDIRDLIEKAAESEDPRILRSVIALPVQICASAIREGDHYLFQEFAFAPIWLYGLGQKKDSRNGAALAKASLEQPDELAKYAIVGALRNGETPSSNLPDLMEFAMEILMVFQGLLKCALDRTDVFSFSECLQHASGLLGDERSDYDSFAESKTTEERDVELTGRQVREQAPSLSRQDLLARIDRLIKQRIQELLFGVASFVLSKSRVAQGNSQLKAMLDAALQHLSRDLPTLTRVMMRSDSDGIEDYWHWYLWDLQTTGQVQSIDVSRKFTDLYCVAVLRRLGEIHDTDVSQLKLPHSRSIGYLVGKDGPVTTLLKEIEQSSSKWNYIVSDKAVEAIPLFRKLLDTARLEQERDEKQRLRLLQISPTKVIEFTKRVTRSFRQYAHVRQIIIQHQLYVDKTRESSAGAPERKGWNRLDDKGAFISKPDVEYVDWGVWYGMSLGISENSHLFSEIMKDCVLIPIEEMDRRANELFRTEDPLMIATPRAATWLWRTSPFKPKWQLRNPAPEVDSFSGFYYASEDSGRKKPIPVYVVPHESEQNKPESMVLLLDAKKLGHLVQYSPLSSNESASNESASNVYENMLYVCVRSFSEDESAVKRLTDSPPEWLSKLGDTKAQVDHLTEHVWVQVFERYEWKRHENFQGYRIDVLETMP
jgi:hypothetical protein